MLLSVAFGLLSTIILSAPPALAINEAANPSLSAKLKTAPTHLDFWNSLSSDDYMFDWNTQSQDPWKPGSVLSADVATWPLLVAGNQAIAQLNLGPCSMLAPHIHPHAAKVVVQVAGSVRTYMRAENGAIDRQTVLTPGKMTYFPKSSFHSMVNEGTPPLALTFSPCCLFFPVSPCSHSSSEQNAPTRSSTPTSTPTTPAR